MEFTPVLTVGTASAVKIVTDPYEVSLRPVTVRCLDETCDVSRRTWERGVGDFAVTPRGPLVKIVFEAEEYSGFQRVVTGVFEGPAR